MNNSVEHCQDNNKYLTAWCRIGCELYLTEEEVRKLNNDENVDMREILMRGLTFDSHGDNYFPECDGNNKIGLTEGDIALSSSEQSIELFVK